MSFNDVSERKVRERELEARVEQQEVVTDLGKRALEARLMAETVGLYFSYRATELAAKTIQNHRYRMNAFLEWCDENETITSTGDRAGHPAVLRLAPAR